MSPQISDYNLYTVTVTYSLVVAIEKIESLPEDACMDVMETHIKDIHEWNRPTIALQQTVSEKDLPGGWADNVCPYTVVDDTALPATLRQATIADFIKASAIREEAKKLKEAHDHAKNMNTFLLGRIVKLENEIEELKKAQKRQ